MRDRPNRRTGITKTGHRYSMLMTDEQFEAIRREAFRKRLLISEILREAIDQHIRRERDAGRKRGGRAGRSATEELVVGES